MSSISMHKSGGSLTQSSLLLIGKGMKEGYVRQIINLSADYQRLLSLAFQPGYFQEESGAPRGESRLQRVAALAEYAREEINKIGGYYAFSRELINGNSIYDFDTTKLSVHTLEIGLGRH